MTRMVKEQQVQKVPYTVTKNVVEQVRKQVPYTVNRSILGAYVPASALPADCAAIYIGDDDTDELAFVALKNQISIRVGTARGTRARYWLPAPADVLRFLDRVEGELQ